MLADLDRNLAKQRHRVRQNIQLSANRAPT
jgi:hypothetical protein